MASIRGYLNDLSRQLRLGPKEEDEILHELQDHINDKAQELIESGVSSDEAYDHALDDFGGSDTLARQFYAIHAQSSWHHTVLAVLPHVLIAVMFALHIWTSPGWMALMLVVAMVISVYGWRKGRPRWTYTWLGYTLIVPIVSWGLAMSAVGYGAWGIVMRGFLPLSNPIYLVSFGYLAGSLWIVVRVLSKAARPDWVMASLAILPLPFLGYWFFYFHNRAESLAAQGLRLHDVDNSAAAVFLMLAVITAVFFRVGNRVFRVALLIIAAPSVLILA
ncbi:MAG: permease prefix domain 1-containing protein, partial [Ardenticatenaceae bacterium]